MQENSYVDTASAVATADMPAPLRAGQRTNSVLVFCFKLALSFSLIYLLIQYLGTETLERALANANVGLLLLGCMGCIGQVALTALKWRLLLLEQGVRVKFTALFEMQLTAVFMNVFMPSVLCGDAYRAARLRRHTGSISSALPSIIVDRGTGLLALLTIGIVGLLYVFTPVYLLSGVCAFIVAVAGGYLFLTGPVSQFMTHRSRSSASQLIVIGRKVTAALLPSRALFCAVAISLLFQLNLVLIVAIWALAMDLVSADLLHLLVAVPAVGLVEMIPFSVNGVGIREAAFSLLFREMDLDSGEGLVLGLTVSTMKYAAGLLCGILLLGWPIVNTVRARALKHSGI